MGGRGLGEIERWREGERGRRWSERGRERGEERERERNSIKTIHKTKMSRLVSYITKMLQSNQTGSS